VPDEVVREVARSLTAQPVTSVERQIGGGNNRLFRVRVVDGHSLALKEYPKRTDDTRDRLAAEFGALEFLGRCGVTDVPQAIAADRERDFALYEWIEGEPVRSPDGRDIDAAVTFVAHLRAIRNAAGATDLPLASESCLSAAEIVAQVGRRHERLKKIAESEPRLAQFLTDGFGPTANAVEAWSRKGYESCGWAFDAPIAIEQRSLSPSDFGFHNVIRRSDGRLIFVDFEYFGWDDPAKLVADFLLHPGMLIAPQLYERFRTGALQTFGEEGAFAARLALVYPLYGLRWCMILLNEFLPERWEARRRAGIHTNWEAATTGQLEKARQRISTVRQYLMDHAQ
jgi:aminoglycoside phosphotransferase (APT) family kinase protein